MKKPGPSERIEVNDEIAPKELETEVPIDPID